ncbi:hypothetical protein QTP88_011895 [Uroleucon formosanum]
MRSFDSHVQHVMEIYQIHIVKRFYNNELEHLATSNCNADKQNIRPIFSGAYEVKKQFDNTRKRMREESSYTSPQIFRQEISLLFQKGTPGNTLDPNLKEEIERIIAFSSNAQREAASTYGNFFFDETFKNCINPKIYTIQVDIRSTSSETNVIPERKGKKCYMELLELDIRIYKTLKSYEEDRDLKKCLKILSFIQKLSS